jgi:hypothetical protein
MKTLRTCFVVLLMAGAAVGCSAGRAKWLPSHDPAAPYAETPESCVGGTTEIEKARQRACQMQAAYADAMGRAQVLSNKINLGLLGLGAATAGLAMTGTTGVPLIALALAGATGFTGNGLFVPGRAYAEVFEVGANASACVRSLADAYVTAAGKTGGLQLAMKALGDARDSLERDIAALNSALAKASSNERTAPYWLSAKQVADEAAEIVTGAGTVISSASEQIRGINVMAPSELNRALTTIRVAIKKAALSASPDTTAVQNAARAFQADVPAAYTGLLASRIGKAEKSLAESESAKAANAQRRRAANARRAPFVGQNNEDPIAAAADKVKATLDAVRTAMAGVRTASTDAAVPNAQARLQECITKAQNAPQQRHVQVTPADVNVKAGDTTHVAVSGGAGPYRTDLIGADPAKTDIKLSMGNVDPSTKVADLTITVGADVSGQYTILVSDAGSVLQTPNRIHLTVTAAPKDAPALTAKPKDRTDNTVAPGGTIALTVSGGKSPYTSNGVSKMPSVTGVAPDSMTVAPSAGSALTGDTINVTAKADAPPGTYTVSVFDSTGGELEIPVVVSSGSAPNRASPLPADQQTPEDVRTAQVLLRRRGYDAGTADAQLGPRTRDAITKFQQAEKLAVTGRLNAATRKALGLSEAALTTSEVQRTQGVLRDLGLYDGALDGIQGPKAMAAIAKFQKQAGIAETGVLDAATHDAIVAAQRRG